MFSEPLSKQLKTMCDNMSMFTYIPRDATGTQYIPPHQPHVFFRLKNVCRFNKKRSFQRVANFRLVGYMCSLGSSPKMRRKAFKLINCKPSKKDFKQFHRLVGNLRRLVGKLFRFKNDMF